jgi:hypothetical protein
MTALSPPPAEETDGMLQAVPGSEVDPRDVYRGLFRFQPDEDIRWSGIGPPDHRRAYFNLIDLVGYASVKPRTREVQDKLRDWKGGPPYHIYACYEWQGEKPSKDKHYATEAAAKRAGRAWIVQWLRTAKPEPLIWTMGDSGFHFSAHVPNGPRVANYYFCDKATADWHEAFRVWFGGTYYMTEFATPDEARAAVQKTWERWLAVAKARFVPANLQNR